jgi:hypothetical protein
MLHHANVVDRSAPAPGKGLEIVEDDSDHAIGVWHNSVFAIWRGETTQQSVAHLAMILFRVHQTERANVGLLQYVAPDASVPSKDTRDALANLLREARGRVACSAVVAPGTGFRIAAGRAVVTGIAMLARPGFPHQVFSTLEEAAEWQSRLLPRTAALAPSASDIVRAVQVLLSGNSPTPP